MANGRAALGYVSANESTGSSGTSYTKGAERMAVEDRRRMMWLNAQKDTWRKTSEDHRQAMKGKARRVG
jgi:hypothetical protein